MSDGQLGWSMLAFAVGLIFVIGMAGLFGSARTFKFIFKSIQYAVIGPFAIATMIVAWLLTPYSLHAEHFFHKCVWGNDEFCRNLREEIRKKRQLQALRRREIQQSHYQAAVRDDEIRTRRVNELLVNLPKMDIVDKRRVFRECLTRQFRAKHYNKYLSWPHEHVTKINVDQLYLDQVPSEEQLRSLTFNEIRSMVFVPATVGGEPMPAADWTPRPRHNYAGRYTPPLTFDERWKIGIKKFLGEQNESA